MYVWRTPQSYKHDENKLPGTGLLEFSTHSLVMLVLSASSASSAACGVHLLGGVHISQVSVGGCLRAASEDGYELLIRTLQNSTSTRTRTRTRLWCLSSSGIRKTWLHSKAVKEVERSGVSVEIANRYYRKENILCNETKKTCSVTIISRSPERFPFHPLDCPPRVVVTRPAA